MRYDLFDFQQDATNALLDGLRKMRISFENDELSTVSFTAPTGAGKTVIAAAAIEALFYGKDQFSGDKKAAVLWLSDSPSLNEQTMKRFDEASDKLNTGTVMETVGPEFAEAYDQLSPRHVYFLNRQLLSSKGRLTNNIEGGRTFWDILSNTINETDTLLYLFIDEAHRGLGKNTTSDATNKTIYAKLIDGQNGLNPPMPCVVGISATPERFNAAMKDRKNREWKVPVDVPVSEVRASGLIKDVIELRTPKESADTRHQDLTQACVKLSQTSKLWSDYCADKPIPTVVPLMVVQVEDRVTKETLEKLCMQILRVCPWLNRDCFANVFGEHEDIDTSVAKIPYCPPEDVSEKTEIRVLFAKDAVSTGWDCPRAEVIYSRRKRNDPTYIAQLIGRMIRTPLARRIESVEALNTVTCYLPEYDSATVEAVVDKLKEDNVAVDENGGILKNPADVGWYGPTRSRAERRLKARQEQISGDSNSDAIEPARETASLTAPITPDDDLDADLGKYQVNTDDETTEDLEGVLERTPKVDSKLIRDSFESIITRQVRHDKPNVFVNLWNCVDILASDGKDPDVTDDVRNDFCHNIDAEIDRNPSAFGRAVADITHTTMTVNSLDPLTGAAQKPREESVLNDSDRLKSYYDKAVNTFSAADLVKDYVNGYASRKSVDFREAVTHISAAAACFEVVQGMEKWAEEKTKSLLEDHPDVSGAISDENKTRWDSIVGSTLPYVESTLNINSSVTHQNMDYDRYPKHIISDENGWAYLKLNNLEKKVVATELARPLTAAWYRNEPRNLNASLAIPYMLGGEWQNMYPDFIFFQETRQGKINRIIVDPHGDWLGDSVAKLQGYVKYLEAHPDMFTSVRAVADEKDGECRYLDLTDTKVQDKIRDFNGSSAKELFLGPLSKPYKINHSEFMSELLSK